MPDNTAGAAPEILRATHAGYIDFLATTKSISGAYLEIGPDIGLATEAAIKVGTLTRTILVEPNTAVHQQLREASGQVDSHIVTSLDGLASPAEADTAVLIHVLDHLTDPLGYLKDLRLHLAPNASVLIVVHNTDSLLRKALGVRWPPLCLQHPQLFSPTTLASMLSTAGYNVIASRPTVNVFPMRHAVRTAASIVGLSGNWVEHVPNQEIRLKLGNFMMVATA